MKLLPDAQDVLGTNVRKVQYLLRERGYNLVPDGFYGLRTEGRVREFQAQEGMRIDGVVGAETWSSLILEVRRGDRGDAVRAVQIQFASLKRDGIFGPRTLSRVRRFQLDRGLKPDGIVGPRTWSALAASPMLDLDYPWRDASALDASAVDASAVATNVGVFRAREVAPGEAAGSPSSPALKGRPRTKHGAALTPLNTPRDSGHRTNRSP